MIIKCIVFRPSGKCYTDEFVKIPIDTPSDSIPDRVKNHRSIKSMIYVGETQRYKVPFLIPAEV